MDNHVLLSINSKILQYRGEWSEDVVEVKEFNTIKDFWEIINNIQDPDTLPFDSSYYLFKV